MPKSLCAVGSDSGSPSGVALRADRVAALQEISTGTSRNGTFCLRGEVWGTYSGAMPWGLSVGLITYSEGVASVPLAATAGV